MRTLLSPLSVACLLILMVERYGAEKQKATSRVRFSRKTLLKVSGREQLRDAFISEVRADLEDLGWHLIQTADGFAMLRAEVARGWTLISARRVGQEVARAKARALSEDDLLELLEDAAEETDEEGDVEGEAA